MKSVLAYLDYIEPVLGSKYRNGIWVRYGTNLCKFWNLRKKFSLWMKISKRRVRFVRIELKKRCVFFVWVWYTRTLFVEKQLIISVVYVLGVACRWGVLKKFPDLPYRRHRTATMWRLRRRVWKSSLPWCGVADPGCLSQIPDPGSDFFHPGSELSPSRIPDPHQRIEVF